MTHETLSHELPNLAGEVERYLAAVDAFRSEGACPTWAPEQAPPDWWAKEHLHPGRAAARLSAPSP